MLSGAGSIGAISSAFVMTSEIFEPKVLFLRKVLKEFRTTPRAI